MHSLLTNQSEEGRTVMLHWKKKKKKRAYVKIQGLWYREKKKVSVKFRITIHYLLQTCKFFIQEVNYYCTKNKTWEDCEEASNTLKKKKKRIFFVYIYWKRKRKIPKMAPFLEQSWQTDDNSSWCINSSWDIKWSRCYLYRY